MTKCALSKTKKKAGVTGSFKLAAISSAVANSAKEKRKGKMHPDLMEQEENQGKVFSHTLTLTHTHTHAHTHTLTHTHTHTHTHTRTHTHTHTHTHMHTLLHSKNCEVNYSYVRWRIHMCDMAHSCVCHDSFTCVTRIHMCDMTHSDVCHDSFICVT